MTLNPEVDNPSTWVGKPRGFFRALIGVDEMIATTKVQKEQRAKEVRAMLDQDASINDIARHFGLSQQAVHKFLKLRGWKTKEALRRTGGEPTEEEKKKAERAERRRQMKKDVVDRS